MDRFQMIQHASQAKKLRYNSLPNRAGFVDLTLRLGLPNHDYYNNNVIGIGQSLDLNLLSPQQSNLNYSNGFNVSTNRDQAPMQYWQYGHNNNMVSGDHNTGNNNMVINSTGGPNNNYFGRFNQTGINMGQITKRTAAEADQILSSMAPQILPLSNSSSFNAIMNNRSSAFSPVPLIQLNDYNNNIFLNPNTTGTIMNNVNGTRRKTIINGMKRKRGDDGDDQMLQAQAEAFVFDFGEEEEEEEEEEDQDHHVVEIDDGDDANKCCSNIYCRTQTTPMWRRGPLGPKSLYKACGIKYRKREEIWRALEIAAAKARNNSGTSNLNYLQ